MIRAANPELDTDEETMVIGGTEINPRLHLTFDEIVATQLADDDPLVVWATAERLRRLGYGRHEILHMLGSAMAGPQIWEALHNRREYDGDEHRAALSALPRSWERQRPGGPARRRRHPRPTLRRPSVAARPSAARKRQRRR